MTRVCTNCACVPERTHNICRNCTEYGYTSSDMYIHVACKRCHRDICGDHAETINIETEICEACSVEYAMLVDDAMEVMDEEWGSDSDSNSSEYWYSWEDGWGDSYTPPTLPPPCKVDGVENMTCSICLHDFVVDECVVRLECNPQHCYHTACIADWWRVSTTCPLCRK